MGIIRKLREKWADSETVDLMVIIGLDKQKALDKMARKVGGEVFLDRSGSVLKGLGSRGVPHWFVLDSDNKILRNFSGYYTPVEEQIKRLGF
ncbi:MAG TPA: hypothetical protein ENG95_04455 [Nitrospirae bacterium]|nr:hypothetical protein BMS3Abin10_02304 [bacterium BMS3Abin10]GBE38556.1 hypothetical protein BMS3Bbin08_01163 [bacterium BMS3Bbin08]HDH50138.1 hypothetical protein [Nitrospirota bacterium]HDK16562.1 hypothetical protein [Nitrospirota bacterium]HDO25876.1 hypothetical protein [Nitrospirota bacterium]